MIDKKMIEELEAEQSMFVQTAQGVTSDGTTLTLNGSRHQPSASRIGLGGFAGQMATTDFVEL